jgi:serine/threonine protein phosphatase 1
MVLAITYAVPDIHGRFDLTLAAVDLIAADVAARGRPPFKIVFLGDYVDRGPESAQVVELLRTMQRDATTKVIVLRGNHEDIMVQTVTSRVPDTAWWYGNGGDATMRSYGLPTPRDFKHDFCRTGEQREGLARLMDDARWLDALPLWYEDEHRVYVHAGIPDEQLPLERQDPHQLMWMRYPGGDRGGADYGWKNKHVVHGHHPHNAPMRLAHRTDLDGHAWVLGKLLVGVFDDEKEGGPVDVLVAEAGRAAATASTPAPLGRHRVGDRRS